jgi:hypothetical protein
MLLIATQISGRTATTSMSGVYERPVIRLSVKQKIVESPGREMLDWGVSRDLEAAFEFMM